MKFVALKRRVTAQDFEVWGQFTKVPKSMLALAGAKIDLEIEVKEVFPGSTANGPRFDFA